MDILDEAKELIPWLDKDSLVERMAKHIEYLRLQNESARQQNAELVEALEDLLRFVKNEFDPADIMVFKAQDTLAKATGVAHDQ